MKKKKNKTSEFRYPEEIDSAIERGDAPRDMVDHLSELRSRLLIVLTSIIVFLIGFFFISDKTLNYLSLPFIKNSGGIKLNVFNLVEGFTLRLKSSFIFALLSTLPVIFLQLWGFIKPAINVKDRLFYRISLFFSLLLLYGGIAFTFYIIFPFAIKMLLNFTPEDMNNTISAGKYLSFLFLFCTGMAAIFELPIIVMILTKLGIVSPKLLISKRKYAIVLIWIVAAVITPPDVITQCLLAIPLMFLYEISVIISKIIIKQKRKKL